MYFLRSGIPFVRLLLVFMIGIFTGMNCFIKSSEVIVYCGLSLYILLLYLEKQKLNLNFAKSFAAYVILFFLGITLINERTESNRSDHYIHSLGSFNSYTAVVINTPEYTDKTIKLSLEVRDIHVDSLGWFPSSGKILLYIRKDSLLNLEKGTVLLIQGKPSLPAPPANPGQFDYAAYLKRQNINTTHFITKKNFSSIGHEKRNPVIVLADDLRNFCEKKIKAGIKGENEYRLATALLLGTRAGLDEKLSDAYSSTGTVHALAVSGLHVSLVYFIIVYTFGFIKKIKHGKYIFAFISILIFWFYALVTGFSPSVIRAVSMFSVVLIAGLVKRNSGIYNTLAFSAFVILCIEPFWIMDIGFQFSFLAVVGIAYVYPVMYEWIEIKNSIAEKLWSTICISMAAQIAVSPLSIYYFHSFPLLFLPFNMLIVPLSSVALYTGLAGLGLYKIAFISDFAFLLTEYLVYFMNQIVLFPSGSALLKIDFLFFNFWELVLLYLFLIFLFFSLKNRNYKSFVYSAMWLGMFWVSMFLNSILENSKTLFTIYQVKNTTALSLIHKGNGIVLSDHPMAMDNKNFRFNIYNHLAMERINSLIFCSFENDEKLTVKKYPYGNLIVWQGIKIFRIDDRAGEELPSGLLNSIDVLLVSNSEYFSYLKKTDSKIRVVIDSSIKENSSGLAEEFYDVRKSGAFVLEK